MADVKRPIIPPGGFAGFSQQSQATQALFSAAIGKKTPRKKRKTSARPATRKARKKPAVRKRRRKASGRLKKGSPEARRRMAQLRKMRKKKRR
jgi:hypothetical protein